MLLAIGYIFVGFAVGCAYTESKHNKAQREKDDEDRRWKQMLQDQEDGKYD